MGWPGGIIFISMGFDVDNKAVTEFYGILQSHGAVEQMSSYGLSMMQWEVAYWGTASNSLQQAFSSILCSYRVKCLSGILLSCPRRRIGLPMGFHGLAISNQTKQVDMAWNLVRWLAYDTEGAIPFARAENRVGVT